jgi:putative tricarboxylic transport membrane protein
MKKGNLAFAALSAILGGIIISIALGYPTAADYGTGVPGPGLWPIAISVVLIGCAVLLAVKSLKMPEEKNTEIKLWNEGTKRVYITMAVLFIYCLALEFLGFLISTVILEFFFIQWFAKKKPWITAIFAVGITLVIYLVFQYILNVPVGSFGIFSI